MHRVSLRWLSVAVLAFSVVWASPLQAHGLLQVVKSTWQLMQQSSKNAPKTMPRQQYGVKLRQKMQAVNRACEIAWQAHHIIPVVLDDHRAVKKCKLDINDAANGICMPGSKAKAQGPVTQHHGYHAGYNKAVKGALDGIPKNASKAETCRLLEKIQTCLREGIDAGTPLYGDHVAKAWSGCQP